MIGADLNALFNCDIVHNVAAPPDPKLFPQGIHTDSIKPGRAVWSYLDGTTQPSKGRKRWPGWLRMGFEYIVIEGFWRNWSEAQLKDVVDYIREHGVKVIVWNIRASVQDPEA